MEEREEVRESSPLLRSTVEPTGCGASLACDPRRNVHRYLVLVFICFLSFGSYYVYDNPAALQDVMKRDLSLDTEQFSLFYSLYSWPNVILCFFGGFLIDRVFGVRLGAIIFCVLVTLGQVIFAFGALSNIYWLMLAGRFIFGMGGESLGVAQNTYAVKWFQGRALNMVFGLQLSFSRVGSTVNMNTMRPLYDSLYSHYNFAHGYQCVGVTLFIGVTIVLIVAHITWQFEKERDGGAFCLLSCFCAAMMFYFDRRAQRILRRDETRTDEEVIQFRDIKDFSIKFWLLCIICVAYYVTIFPFVSVALVFFESKYDLDASVANVVNSLIYFISAGASPLCGFLIDRIGMNIYWLLCGVILTVVCHGLIAFTFLNPFVPMVFMGIAYSVLASALWPLVAQIIPRHQIATAYGIMQSIQNLGLAVVAILIGVIVDKKGYLILEVTNLAWLCVALIATVVLYIVDTATGGKLNMTARQRRRLIEGKSAEDDNGHAD